MVMVMLLLLDTGNFLSFQSLTPSLHTRMNERAKLTDLSSFMMWKIGDRSLEWDGPSLGNLIGIPQISVSYDSVWLQSMELELNGWWVLLLLMTFALEISSTIMNVSTSKAGKIMVEAAFDLVEWTYADSFRCTFAYPQSADSIELWYEDLRVWAGFVAWD